MILYGISLQRGACMSSVSVVGSGLACTFTCEAWIIDTSPETSLTHVESIWRAGKTDKINGGFVLYDS